MFRIINVRALQNPSSEPTGRNAQVRFAPIRVPTQTTATR
jgi:hypothetical protein